VPQVTPNGGRIQAALGHQKATYDKEAINSDGSMTALPIAKNIKGVFPKSTQAITMRTKY
jgi:hypothetical protein